VVYLEVFDAKGRLLAVLIDGIRREPGVHTVPWDGRDSHGTGLSCGVYFYRFRAGDFVETRKMILAQ
jgi:flagellar hook assembly protein FlgD